MFFFSLYPRVMLDGATGVLSSTCHSEKLACSLALYMYIIYKPTKSGPELGRVAFWGVVVVDVPTMLCACLVCVHRHNYASNHFKLSLLVLKRSAVQRLMYMYIYDEAAKSFCSDFLIDLNEMKFSDILRAVRLWFFFWVNCVIVVFVRLDN